MTLITSTDFIKNWTPKRPLDRSILQTGFRVIDEQVCGLRPGRIYVVAGRPGMGVTTTLRSMTINVLRQGAKVLFCTSGKEIEIEIVRLLSNITRRIHIDYIEWDILSDEQRSLLQKAKSELAGHDLSFSNEKSFSALLDDFKAFLSDASCKSRLIVIDNPNLLNADNASNTSIGRALSNLAHDYKVPILLAAGALPRADKKSLHDSGLADVKAAYDIIDFADVVLFLRREELYNPDTEERGLASLKIVKNRGKSIGRYQFANFFGETSAIRHDEFVANWRPS